MARLCLLLMVCVGAAAVPRSLGPSVSRGIRPRTHPVELHAAKTAPNSPSSPARSLAAGWGVCGFLGILVQAIGRLAPVAVQPLIQRDLTLLQWGLCVLHAPSGSHCA
eukprot:scaffold246756_cov40-Tisochrysis_lutea.AAC.1